MWRIIFDEGTILLETPEALTLEQEKSIPDEWVWDRRVDRYRARGCDYRTVRTWVHRLGVPYEDEVATYQNLSLRQHMVREPRDYQREAIDAWKQAGKRGLILLPTGTGKSYVAQMAMVETQRSTLVIAPTIDLVNQWYEILSSAFHVPVGMLGGGYHEIEDLTVSTYDSAYIHMDRLGHRFGLVIFDEVHHLPGQSYMHAASCIIAPFRLGLTATLERPDDRHLLLDEVVGNVVYHRSIRELAGEYLADYHVERIVVDLTPEEAESYHEAREIYRSFVREKNIRMSGPKGWGHFVSLSSRSRDGRRAMKAYQRARRLALSAPSKLQDLEGLLRLHSKDRVIIFTNDNNSVYRISRKFLIPAITHQTDAKERRELLQRFNDGTYPCLVTSRVLNEGVNIPEANVGIVLSGTGSVREHVQRLERILRKQPEKRAILYEIVTGQTVETFVSDRRREHDAYRDE
ncbi:MAG TPA: helicase [Myxococcales bacterium]|nr:helicase [Myxococcales bacterium]